MNNWIGTGRLTENPTLRYTTSGTAVCSFTLAVDRARKDAQGNKQTDFIQVVAWQKLGELCAEYLAKGRKALVTGELQSRTYENREGQKVKVWEINANSVEFLDRGEPQQTTTQSSSMQKATDYDPFADDDLPF
jgi:single-strand DNA-binding protein